jgi:hypothetical protein
MAAGAPEPSCWCACAALCLLWRAGDPLSSALLAAANPCTSLTLHPNPYCHPPAGLQATADLGVLAELEAHGYPAVSTLRHLSAGDANHATASYYLLVEAKAEAAQRLQPAKPWPFPAVGSRSSRHSSSRAAAASAATDAEAAAAGAGDREGGQQRASGGGSSVPEQQQQQPQQQPQQQQQRQAAAAGGPVAAGGVAAGAEAAVRPW